MSLCSGNWRQTWLAEHELRWFGETSIRQHSSLTGLVLPGKEMDIRPISCSSSHLHHLLLLLNVLLYKVQIVQIFQDFSLSRPPPKKYQFFSTILNGPIHPKMQRIFPGFPGSFCNTYSPELVVLSFVSWVETGDWWSVISVIEVNLLERQANCDGRYFRLWKVLTFHWECQELQSTDFSPTALSPLSFQLLFSNCENDTVTKLTGSTGDLMFMIVVIYNDFTPSVIKQLKRFYF